MSVSVQVHPDKYDVTFFPAEGSEGAFAIVRAYEDRATVSLFLPSVARCDALIRAAVEAKDKLIQATGAQVRAAVPDEADAPEAIEFTTDSRLVVTAPCTKPEAHGAGLLGGKPKVPVLCDRTEHHAPVPDEDATAILATAIKNGTPVIVEDDRLCPAWTGTDGGTVFCDREPGHPGSHHGPGPDEGSEVAWSDEPEGGRS